MRHMNYFIRCGFRGPFIMVVLLGIATLIFIVLIRSYYRHINSPEYNRILDILKQRYAKNEINSDNYTERMEILAGDDSKDTSILVLMERYAKGEIDSPEYSKKRIQLRGTLSNFQRICSKKALPKVK